MENKKSIRSFAKVLHVLAVIAKVCMYIGIVGLVICTIIIPIIFSKVEIEKNRVAIVGIPDARVEIYKDAQSELNIVVNDKKADISKELTDSEKLSAGVLFDMLTDTTKEAVVIYLEGTFILSIVTMILTIISLNYFDKFCKNLRDKDEVFDKDNSKYLRNTAKFFLISYIISIVTSSALSGALTDDFSFNFNSVSIVEILILYMFSHVFAYGHNLEAKKEEPKAIEEKPKATKRKTKKPEEK